MAETLLSPGVLARENDQSFLTAQPIVVGAAIVGRPRLGQCVQHPVGEFRRREHLVVGKVGDARQHVRVSAAQRKARAGAHAGSFGSSPPAAARSLTFIGG